jgi:Cu-Zn family superoxide dismutase
MNDTCLRVAGLAIAAFAFTGSAHAAGVKIPMSSVNAEGIDKPVGSITAIDTPAGLRLTPNLRSLPPGDHGFHVHDKASCEAAPDPDKSGAMTPALGAGGHFDPAHTGKHEGPEGMGHKGDLPVLVVAANGKATKPVVASHLKLSDISGHAVVVHAGGDNFSDQPAKLGGGGARIACGVVP